MDGAVALVEEHIGCVDCLKGCEMNVAITDNTSVGCVVWMKMTARIRSGRCESLAGGVEDCDVSLASKRGRNFLLADDEKKQ